MLRCQLCSTHYTAFWIKNCSKSASAIHAYQKKKWCCAPSFINYHLKSEVPITLCCWLCSTCYTAVRIKNCSKSTSAIKIATMKNTDNFHYEGKPSRAIAKSTLFAVSKDEWNTKEDTGKSMKNALKVFWVNLKACLGLVLPNQYYFIVVGKNRGWFLGDVISWAMPTPLWSLLYSTIKSL